MSNPRISKRAACDRCRGQKLRCQPGGQSQEGATATCARCQRAGTNCSYGTGKRPGRPSTSSAAGAQPRRYISPARAVDDCVESSKANDYFGEQGSQNGPDQNWQPTQYPQGSSRALALDPPGLNDIATTSNEISHKFPSWFHETLSPLRRSDAEATAALDLLDPGYGWLLENDPGIHIPIPATGEGNTQFLDGSIDAFETHTTSARSYTFDSPNEARDFDYINSTSPLERSQPMHTSNARHPELGDSETGKGQAYRETSLIDIRAPPHGFLDRRGGDDNGTLERKHRRIQELSELAMDLYRQLRLVRDAEKQTGNPGATASTFQHQLVGSVLKSSNTFVTLLSGFPESNAPSSPPLSPSASRENLASSSSEREGSSPTAPSREEQDAFMSKDELPPSGSSDSGPADMTTVLQLLACYMRLIHLHSVMHAHFLEYLLNFLPPRTDQSNDPIPPVFPGMQVDDFSLDSFGAFQVMFVLQASLRVLGDVEIMLGLPEDCRISKRKSGVKGVLGASVSERFVKAVMREDAWRENNLPCVRKRLETLWRVLDRHQASDGIKADCSGKAS